MKKIFCVLIFVLSILFIFGCVEKVSWCGNQYSQDVLAKDRCYYNESIKQNKSNLCYSIESEQLKESCLNRKLINDFNQFQDLNNFYNSESITNSESLKSVNDLKIATDLNWRIYASESYYSWGNARPIAIIDWSKKENKIVLLLGNSADEVLVINGVKLSSSENITNLSKVLNPGEYSHVEIVTNLDCEENKRYFFLKEEIIITYTNTKGQELEETGVYDIVGECS